MKKTNNNNVIIIIVSLLVLGVIVAGGIFLINKSKNLYVDADYKNITDERKQVIDFLNGKYYSYIVSSNGITEDYANESLLYLYNGYENNTENFESYANDLVPDTYINYNEKIKYYFDENGNPHDEEYTGISLNKALKELISNSTYLENVNDTLFLDVDTHTYHQFIQSFLENPLVYTFFQNKFLNYNLSTSYQKIGLLVSLDKNNGNRVTEISLYSFDDNFYPVNFIFSNEKVTY